MEQLETAIKAAKDASKIVMSYFGNTKYSLKDAGQFSTQLVTTADIEAEKSMFKNISNRFPAHNFFGEERGFVDNKSEYTWVVDPISSTNNFVHNTPHFAVVVSLLRNNSPLLAVVLDSFYGEMFHAVKNKGAFLKNKKLKVSSVAELDKSIVTTSWSKKNHELVETGISYSNALSRLATTRRIGSLALQLSWIGAGRLDAFIQNENDFFSLIAGSLIVAEAGGKVTDFRGGKYTKRSKNIIASNGKLHSRLIKFMAEI